MEQMEQLPRATFVICNSRRSDIFFLGGGRGLMPFTSAWPVNGGWQPFCCTRHFNYGVIIIMKPKFLLLDNNLLVIH